MKYLILPLWFIVWWILSVGVFETPNMNPVLIQSGIIVVLLNILIYFVSRSNHVP